MPLRLLFPLFFLAALALPARAITRIDVRAHGATGDGQTIDSPAINRAIEEAAAAGGGTVVFPAGRYLCYSIRLKSHITLQLDPGSVIIAADPPYELTEGYDPPEPNPGNDLFQDFGHSHWKNSLIWGIDLEHVAIVGPGKIYGLGLSREINRRDLLPAERLLPQDQRSVVTFPPHLAEQLAAATKPGPHGYPKLKEELAAGAGNKSIALKNCRNVTFRDLTIEHGGNYAILLTGVDNVVIDGLLIDTNRDGIDIDSCRNVRVSNTSINSPYDDGLVLKSSYALGEPRACENITITNCILTGYDEGTVLNGTRTRKEPPRRDGGSVGRFKIGTESTGGFRNITVTNCIFEYSRGLTLTTVDGAPMEDIIISNITMRHVGGTPIFLRLGARLRAPEGTSVGTMRRIKIDNIVAYNVASSAGILISGLAEHPIEDLSLSNIFIHYTGGGTKAQGERVVPEFEKDYPTGAYWGTMPAWGMWVRYVKNFSVNQVEFRAAEPDFRPVTMFEKSNDVAVRDAKFPPSEGVPRIVLKHVDGFTARNVSGLPDLTREKSGPADAF